MIKFRLKMYALPAAVGTVISGLGLASSAVGIKQGFDVAAQNEELADQQRRESSKLRASLDRLANSDVSPEKKQEAAGLFSQRSYAIPAAGAKGVMSNLGGFAKDLWGQFGGNAKSAVKMGAGFAATGYVGNRIATSLKDHDEGRDDKNANFLKKAAITGAAVGGGLLAARRGWIGGQGVKNFMTKGAGGKYYNTAKNVLKENVSPIVKNENGKYGINPWNTIFLAAPTVTYLTTRKGKKDMVNNTSPQQPSDYPPQQEERQYSGWFKGMVSSVGSSLKQMRNQPIGQTLSGGVSKIGNFTGFMGTKGGTQAVQSGLKELERRGIQSGNQYTQAVAKWGQKHKYAMNIASGVAAAGVGGAAMKIGGKIVDTPMKAIDKDAYKMEEQENGQV